MPILPDPSIGGNRSGHSVGHKNLYRMRAITVPGGLAAPRDRTNCRDIDSRDLGGMNPAIRQTILLTRTLTNSNYARFINAGQP